MKRGSGGCAPSGCAGDRVPAEALGAKSPRSCGINAFCVTSKAFSWIPKYKKIAFCRWIYFHLRSKIFFQALVGVGGDRPHRPKHGPATASALRTPLRPTDKHTDWPRYSVSSKEASIRGCTRCGIKWTLVQLTGYSCCWIRRRVHSTWTELASPDLNKSTSVRENVCNNSKNVKSHVFLKSEKNVKKRRPTAYVQFHRPLNHSAFNTQLPKPKLSTFTSKSPTSHAQKCGHKKLTCSLHVEVWLLNA